jgi:glycosyltransferase involved in cell wall biosynthesis
MRIAVVAPTYLPSRRANTIQVMKVCQALIVLGHSVRLAVPLPCSSSSEFEDGFLPLQSGSQQGKYPWELIAEHYGLQHRFDIEWLPSARPWRSYDFALRAVLWARRWAAELLYTRHPQTAALASLLGMAAILEVHDLPRRRMAGRLLRLFCLGKGAQRLVVISRALAMELNHRLRLASRAADFLLVAPDGVDLQRYANLPQPREARHQLLLLGTIQPPLPPERFTAGYSGHLYAGRGIDLLLAIAKDLAAIDFLVVGGEPKQVESLRLRVSQMGLQNVFVSGFVPNAHLPLYQAACDVLLMPYQRHVSASSGGDIAPYLSPMKAFEYLACGRVILSSDLAVLREVLNERNAILLPPEDKEAWMTALQTVASDPQRYMNLAEQARRDSQQYAWEARMQRILEGIRVHTRKTARVGS